MHLTSARVVALSLLAGASSAFTSPRRRPSPSRCIPNGAAPSSPGGLRLSAGDEARALLEKARRLREEAAAMSGQSVEEMERERTIEKERAKEQREIVERARREREESGARGGANRILPVPDDSQAQVQQAAAAVERAFADGVTRQTVRFALLGEEEAMTGELNEWPGGTRQMYREAGRPLTESLLREVRALAKDASSEGQEQTATTSRMPPEVTAEDIWDFDGSAVISAKSSAGSNGDVKAVVFPNTDTNYLNDIEAISDDVGPDRLLLLVNPFWKNIESWGFNILAPNGKKRAQEVIFDEGYDVTYAVLRFSARGEDCVALKSYPYDWQMYAYREDPSWYDREVPVWLGSSEEQPTLVQFSELLNGRPEFKMSKNMRQMQRMMGNDDR